MRKTCIEQATWQNFYHATGACNARGIANGLAKLVPDMMEDLGKERDDRLILLDEVADLLNQFTQINREVKWGYDREKMEPVYPPNYPDCDPVAAAIIDLNNITNGYDKGEWWYRYSHPLMVVGAQILGNIINSEREHYIAQSDSSRWSDKYNEIEFHAGVEEVVEKESGVTLVMEGWAYDKVQRGIRRHVEMYEKDDRYDPDPEGWLNYYGQRMLRAWSSKWMDVIAVTQCADQKRVFIEGEF